MQSDNLAKHQKSDTAYINHTIREVSKMRPKSAPDTWGRHEGAKKSYNRGKFTKNFG